MEQAFSHKKDDKHGAWVVDGAAKENRLFFCKGAVLIQVSGYFCPDGIAGQDAGGEKQIAEPVPLQFFPEQ